MQTVPFRYWFWWLPSTFDTYRADMADVMQVAKNIYAPLVSTFMDSEPQGMIAQDWRVDKTGRIWRFKIKSGLTFDDGVPITSDVVLKNFKRMLWLTREEGLILNSLLPELLEWKSFKDPLKNLYLEGDTLVFRFNRRPLNLFETLSQPIYGIANPKCFDEQGNWKKPFCSSASGQYKIKERTEEKIVLESRHIYTATEYAPEVVEICVPTKNDDNGLKALLSGRGDLAIEPRFALSKDTVAEIHKSKLQIVEEPPVRMYFAQLNHNRSPFNNKTLRQSIRDMFLNLLRKNPKFSAEKIKVDASFIPQGGIGYLPFHISEKPVIEKSQGETAEVIFFPLARYPFPRDRKIQEAIEESLLGALKTHGIKPNITRYNDRTEALRRLRAGDFDAILRFSGILVNDPYADLRMMFMSKLGALIPDPSGVIPGLIEQAEANDNPFERQKIVKKINETIFEQAAVVTYTHSGRAYIHSQGIDISRFNLFSDPIEFRAISWRPTRSKN